MPYIRDATKILLCQVLPGKVYQCKHVTYVYVRGKHISMYPFTFLCEHEKSSFCSRLYVDVLANAKRTTEEETFYLFYEKQLIRTPFVVYVG